MSDINTTIYILIIIFLLVTIAAIAAPPWYRDIRRSMGLILNVYNVHRHGAVMTEPNVDYVLLENNKPTPTIGYLDLTPLMGGDRVELEIQVRVRPQDILKKYITYNVVGPVDNPIVKVNLPPSPFGVKVILRQVSGITGKIINYNWFSTVGSSNDT